MAKSDAAEADDAEGEATQKKAGSSSSMKKLILIVVGVLALVGVSVGSTLFITKLTSNDEPVAKVAKKKAADAEGEEAAAEGEGDATKKDGEGEKGKEGEATAEEEANPDGSPKVAVYLDFEQPFIVNFQDQDQMRYLQITVSVMATDPETIASVKHHMPLIRNNLVMLFSGQTRDTIGTREGKEKIRTDAQAEVQKLLKEQTGKSGIKSLYFTSFVMQ